jgi:hypothetical protein
MVTIFSQSAALITKTLQLHYKVNIQSFLATLTKTLSDIVIVQNYIKPNLFSEAGSQGDDDDRSLLLSHTM